MSALKGTYALVFSIATSAIVQVGALGRLELHPGWVIYTGSAFGSGGLAARLRHHLASSAAAHWHIDYLRPHITPRQVWYTTSAQHCEHLWAAACLRLPHAHIPLARFGASDCGCPAHLFSYPQLPLFSDFQTAAARVLPDEAPPRMLPILKNSFPQIS